MQHTASYRSSPDLDIEELFQKLTEEADDWPVEWLKLTDGNDRWQGLFFIDRHLEESKKKILDRTISRLSCSHETQMDENEWAESCGVSAEERTLLFNFLQPSSGED